ncbi:MAG: hypothetical protein JW836_07660 [Deltaproteobacteria bacterium]|nr:hypothetical protein [Deltaproteobacteria bacterium]
MSETVKAVIFPHSFVSEVNLKRVLSLFNGVLLCRLGFAEKEIFMAKYAPDMVQVLNPAEHLIPGEAFGKLLSEYRRWISVNGESGASAFFAYAQERFQGDPPVYEIRGMIRNMGKTIEQDEKAKALKRLLTLSLAEELEEEQASTQALLRAMGGLDSPLKGALEDEAPSSFLSEVTALERGTLLTEERLAQILDAWVSFYGERIPGRSPLITTEPQVFRFIAETWEEFTTEGQRLDLPGVTFRFPDISNLDRDEFLKVRETLITGSGPARVLADFFHNPEMIFSDQAVPIDDSAWRTGGVQWTFLYFVPKVEGRFPKRYAFMEALSGKIIGLVGGGD